MNSAGVEYLGFAEETTLEDARAVIETDFFGVVRVTHAVLSGGEEADLDRSGVISGGGLPVAAGLVWDLTFDPGRRFTVWGHERIQDL